MSLTAVFKLRALNVHSASVLLKSAGCSYFVPRVLNFHSRIKDVWVEPSKPAACTQVWLGTPVRYLGTNASARKKWKPFNSSDRVPASYTLVYSSSIKEYIALLHTSVAVMGLTTAGLSALRWESLLSTLATPDGLLFVAATGALACGFGAMCYFARTVPIRIYHDNASGYFLAVRRTWLGRLRQLAYSPADIRRKANKGADDENLRDSVSVVIKGQTCYINASDFVSPIYYNVHIHGGDEQQDLKRSLVSGPRF